MRVSLQRAVVCAVFKHRFLVRHREATTLSAFIADSSLKSVWCVPAFTKITDCSSNAASSTTENEHLIQT